MIKKTIIRAESLASMYLSKRESCEPQSNRWLKANHKFIQLSSIVNVLKSIL